MTGETFFVGGLIMSQSSRPGVGKTTVMRGISRVLSDQLLKRVVCALVSSFVSVSFNNLIFLN